MFSRSPGLESTAQRTLSESENCLRFMTDVPSCVLTRREGQGGSGMSRPYIRDEVHHEGFVPVSPQSRCC